MFECRYKADDTVIKEFVNKILAHKMIGQGMFMIVIAIVFTALSMKGSHKIFTYVYIGIALISVFAAFYAPKKMMKRFKESDNAFFNGKADETIIRFDEDKITVIEEPSQASFSYDQVERILVYNVICVLMISKSNGIVVKKDSFGEKSFEEFYAFINEKCVNKNKQAEEEKAAAEAKKRKKHNKNTASQEKDKEEIKEASIEEVKAEIPQEAEANVENNPGEKPEE